uniref:hypothetical protein n=2 Tax=Tenacibaculum maritimum TaxID=107401 RepID=UPI0038781763
MYSLMCIRKGNTQAIDSAPVKANASMDSLELKVPEQDLESHIAANKTYKHSRLTQF